MADLTDKQRIFVEQYAACLNATEAARRAGYSVESARSIGSENLTKPDIRAAIDERLAEIAMGRNEVLARLADHARGSMDDFLTASGRGVRLDIAKGLKAGKGHLIKKYSKTDKGTSIELYDAQAALEKIGRHHGLFLDKVALTDPTGTKEYADSTLDTLRQRLIAQVTASASGATASGVPDVTQPARDEGAAL